ncbi:MAG: alpha/beta hydrolase family protein [Acidimicrobiales bacterium]
MFDVPEDIVVRTERVGDADVHFIYFETWDGLFAPMALRLPDGDGPFPIILLGSGNGGEAMRWHRDVLANRSYILDALIDAGFACAWLRYRTEVELGYNDGGVLVRDVRQGREMFNRSPLEYEDEIAAIEFVKQLEIVDGDRVGLVGVSHAGEMILKLTSEYHGAAVGVCCEPASHEYLALTPDQTAFVNEETQMRNIEDMQMAETDKVRRRIDVDVATQRIAGIETPLLVMGRDEDHLQGIFRTTYELLEEAGKEVEWISYDHPLHGYIYPELGPDGTYLVDDTQRDAIAHVVSYLKKHL